MLDRTTAIREIDTVLAALVDIKPMADYGVVGTYDTVQARRQKALASAEEHLLAMRRVLAHEEPDAALIYSLIVAMFRQPQEILRSVIAQRLARELEIGTWARDPRAQKRHLDAARDQLERDKAGGFLPATDQLGEWTQAERVRDVPEVDQAIRNLLADHTGDNATMIVREVFRAIGLQTPDASGVADGSPAQSNGGNSDGL